MQNQLFSSNPIFFYDSSFILYNLEFVQFDMGIADLFLIILSISS